LPGAAFSGEGRENTVPVRSETNVRALSWRAHAFGNAPAFTPNGIEEQTMQVTTATSDALQKYLDLASDQMKLTAENMANVDTPGYKTQGLDFSQEFSRALNADGSTPVSAKTLNVDGLTARPDGNNVSLDREGMQLAKTQLEFRTGIALLRSEYTRVMDAIHADK
jgi:flagellar basal-body rod protein FlgB